MGDFPRDKSSQSLDCCPAGGKCPSSSAPKMASCEKLTPKKRAQVPARAEHCFDLQSPVCLGELGWLLDCLAPPLCCGLRPCPCLGPGSHSGPSSTSETSPFRDALEPQCCTKLMSFNTLQLLALRYNNLLFLFEYLLLSCASLSCKLAIFGERALSGACFWWAATLSSSTSRSPPPPR